MIIFRIYLTYFAIGRSWSAGCRNHGRGVGGAGGCETGGRLAGRSQAGKCRAGGYGTGGRLAGGSQAGKCRADMRRE